MNHMSDAIPVLTCVCAGLAALAFLLATAPARRGARAFGAAAMLLGALALLLALAHPALLPVRSAIVHADGGTDDPRVLAALLLAGAALAGLVPAWRGLGLPAMATLGLLLPGVVVGGALGAVASFAQLRAPMALAGIVLGAIVAVTGIVLAVRARGLAALALQAAATGVLAVCAMLTLHGARLGSATLAEGAAVDTLGTRLYFAGAEAPASDRRVLRVVLYGARDSLALRPELRGPAGRNVRSIAAGGLFSGPLVVPIALEERRTRPHDVQWADASTPLVAGDATIRLAGFRFAKGDTIRLYADLDVTTPQGRQRVSPGVFATPHGEIPFAAEARGFGPIAVAAFDADHKRVGLVLPRLAESGVARVAQLDLRLRPALPVVWAAAALALLCFAFGLRKPGLPSPRP